MDDGVIGDAGTKRIVLSSMLGARPGSLLGLVGPAAVFLARLTRRRGRRPNRSGADASAARGLGELLELVGRLVDRLKVALVLRAPPGRRDVRVPALGHPAPGELNRSLVKRRLELEQKKRLFDIEHLGHDG